MASKSCSKCFSKSKNLNGVKASIGMEVNIKGRTKV